MTGQFTYVSSSNARSRELLRSLESLEERPPVVEDLIDKLTSYLSVKPGQAARTAGPVFMAVQRRSRIGWQPKQQGKSY